MKSKRYISVMVAMVLLLGTVGIFAIRPAADSASAATMTEAERQADIAAKLPNISAAEAEGLYVINNLNNNVSLLSFSAYERAVRAEAAIGKEAVVWAVKMRLRNYMYPFFFWEDEQELKGLGFGIGNYVTSTYRRIDGLSVDWGSAQTEIDTASKRSSLLYDTPKSDFWTAYKTFVEKKTLANVMTNCARLPLQILDKDKTVLNEVNSPSCFVLGVPMSDQSDYPSWLTTQPPYVYLEYTTATYHITFRYLTAMGEWQTDIISAAEGSALTPPTLPTAPYAGFVSWSPGLQSTVTGNSTYEAQYNYELFRIAYMDRGGGVFRVENKTHYDKLSNYILSNYTATENGKNNTYGFMGWSLSQANPSKVDLSEMSIIEDVTLYPFYELIRSVDVNTGDVIVDKTTPAKENIFQWLWNFELLGLPVGKIGLVIVVIVLLPTIVSLVRWLIDLIRGLIAGLQSKRR